MVVPDDGITLQQALDAAADTVWLRTGSYPTPLTITRSKVVLAHPGEQGVSRPLLTSLRLAPQDSTVVALGGLAFAGSVEITAIAPLDLDVVSCRLDSGLVRTAFDGAASTRLRLRSSTTTGAVSGDFEQGRFEEDTLRGLGRLSLGVAAEVIVTRSRFERVDGAPALRIVMPRGFAQVTANTIDGGTVGIDVSGDSLRVSVEHNVLRDVSVVGIRVAARETDVRGNDVRGSATGIAAGGAVSARIDSNRVVDCVGAGMSLGVTRGDLNVENNVVGRCGTGLYVFSSIAHTSIDGNTFYLSAGDGIELGGSGGDMSVTGNIGFRNGGYGVQMGFGPDSRLECNDWFGNARGPASVPDAIDLAVDPAFCDLGADDVHLDAASPLLGMDACGTIGALGQGCRRPVPPGPHDVVVTPCASLGWRPSGGSPWARIGDVHGLGNGSLELHADSGVSAFDRAFGGDPLGELSALGVQLFRTSSSTAPPEAGPWVRLRIDNGQPVDRFSWLVWEPASNGFDPVPVDLWTAADLLSGRFVQIAEKSGGVVERIALERRLDEWLQPGHVVDAAGRTSNEVGPAARVIGYELGAGTASGTLDAALDHFLIGFAGNDTTFEFERGQTTHVALDAPLLAYCDESLALKATVSPPGLTGTIEFLADGVSLGVTPIDRYGVVVRAIPGPALGTHTFVASYSGSTGCILPSVSDTVRSVVEQVATKLALDSGGTVAFGDSVEVNATLHPLTATGASELFDDGLAIAAAPVHSGACAFLVRLGSGLHHLQVRYAGDDCHLPDHSKTHDLMVVDGPPVLHVSSVPIAEGDTGRVALICRARLSVPCGRTVRAAWTTSGGTATAGVDYVSSAGVLVFTSGQTERTFSVPVLGDRELEGDETIGIAWTDLLNASASDTLELVAIRDDDAPDVGIDGDLGAVEGTGAHTSGFTAIVWLRRAADHAVTVEYRTADGTALEGRDYVGRSGTLVFAPAEIRKTVRVDFVPDSTQELDERFIIQLENAHGGRISVPSVAPFIWNDDGNPYLVVDDASAVEGDSATAVMRFRVHLTHPTALAMPRFSYYTPRGSALPDSDYLARTGTSAIARESLGTTIEVPVIGERRCEGDERFSLVVYNLHDVAASKVSGSGVIVDDDCLTPTLVSRFHAHRVTGGVEVRWRLGSSRDVLASRLERRAVSAGTWKPVDAEARREGEEWIVLDADPHSGLQYRLLVRTPDGETVVGPIDVATDALPLVSALRAASPNPCRDALRVEYDLAEPGLARIVVTDLLGRRVSEIEGGQRDGGRHVVTWRLVDGRIRPGLYFVVLEVGSRRWSRRIVVMR